MAPIEPVEGSCTIRLAPDEVGPAVDRALLPLGGSRGRPTNAWARYTYGSLLLSRLLGEFFVPGHMLPKAVDLWVEPNDDGTTRVMWRITDTHALGFKVGFRKKYHQSFVELSAKIEAALAPYAGDVPPAGAQAAPPAPPTLQAQPVDTPAS